MRLIALDLHQDNVLAATLDLSVSQPTPHLKRYSLKDDGISQFIATLDPADIVVLESTTNAFWFHRAICSRVSSCHVLDMNAIHLRGNKTDALDARKLLQILSSFVLTNTLDQMPTVYVPPESVSKLRGLFSTYQLLNKLSTQVRNRIYALYRQNGLVIPRRELRKASFRATLLSSVPLPDFWAEQVRILLVELDQLFPRILTLKKAILSLGFDLFPNEIDLLTTIPGFSPFTAVALMSDIVDIRRFSSAKKLCSYLRTAPSLKASNRTRHLGSVPKSGRSLSVSLLTQSINHLKAASPAFGDFYQRLRSGKSAGKSRLALVRKTIVTAYYMLSRGTEFSHKDEVNYERKHRVTRAFLRDYHPPGTAASTSIPA